MAFNYEEIIIEKQETIDKLINWVKNNTTSKEAFENALRECEIS